MKVLIVGTFGRYHGVCPNHEYIAETFEALGHQVVKLNESDCSADDVIKASQGCDIMLVEEGRLYGDHSSTKDGKNIIIGLFQRVMDEVKIPIISWLTNLFYNIGPREVELQTNPIFKAKIVFSTDGGHQKEFEAQGINHVLLRQGIHEPEAYLGKPIYPTTADIVFIGSIYENIWGYRKVLKDFLVKTYGDKFEHLGNSGEIRHDDLNNLLATTKVVVGDSVKSDYYASNRIFEMMGRGGFLVFPMSKGLEEQYIPYKHFLPYQYGDFAGLKEIIDYYLVHTEEREKIRMAGFLHTKKYHTYLHRVSMMLRILEKQGIISGGESRVKDDLVFWDKGEEVDLEEAVKRRLFGGTA